MIGRILGKRYEVQKRIGGGGMAIVYKAWDIFLQRPVAVKVLRAEYVEDSEFLKRFEREAQAAASLSHPNIVAIYDIGEEEGLPYIIMEYVDGQTLKDKINDEAPLSDDEAVEITLQILEALGQAHQHGVIHRDIKPQNILLTKSGRVKVADFGIARAITSASTTIVHSEVIVGSAHYLSPEQARGGYTGEGSDIYSTGVVLYEMLTGEVPFVGDTPVTIALKHLQQEAIPVGELREDISPGLERIVAKAMEKEQGLRFASTEDMIKSLHSWYRGNGDFFDNDHQRTQVIRKTGGERRQMSKRGEKPRKGGPRVSWQVVIGLFLLVALLTTVGYVGYSLMDWLTVPDVNVPSVEGMASEEAFSELRKAGLEGRVTSNRYSNEYPTGHVISQEPRAGLSVKHGSVVNLVVSRGPEWLEGGSPDVETKDFRIATTILSNAGLDVDVQREFSDRVAKDLVIRQNPTPGSPIQRGQTVTIVVSDGPEPLPFSMPSVAGLHVDEAARILRDQGLNYRITNKETAYPTGYVSRQNPDYGQTVKPGDLVDLEVSTGIGITPNVDYIQVTIPSSPAVQNIKVTVYDEQGARRVFQDSVAAGTTLNFTIHWYGQAARIVVAADGRSIEVIDLGGEE